MSTNISKIRRDQLLQKIEEIRLHLLQNAPNPELEGWLSEIASEIKSRKFGLVFEKHREKIDDLILTHLPVLTEDKELTINNGGQWNFLIEGDNLPALELLLKTHKGKIDLIYIDIYSFLNNSILDILRNNSITKEITLRRSFLGV